MSDDFPLGETFGRGACTVERHLQGEGIRRLFLGRGRDGRQMFVAADKLPSKLDLEGFRDSIDTRVTIGVFDLEHVGLTDLPAGREVDPTHYATWGLVERATKGDWLPSVVGGGGERAAITLGRTAGAILIDACEDGLDVSRIRPEYMWAARDNGELAVTGMSARAAPFFAQSRTDAATRPLFDRHYHAPEVESGRDVDDRAITFCLAIMIAEWALGRFPFASKYHRNGVLTGQHLPLTVSPPLAALLSRSMRLDPIGRPSLRELVDSLRG